MIKILAQDPKMLHYLFSSDLKENKFFFPSELNDTGKGMNRKVKVFPESSKLCQNLRF